MDTEQYAVFENAESPAVMLYLQPQEYGQVREGAFESGSSSYAIQPGHVWTVAVEATDKVICTFLFISPALPNKSTVRAENQEWACYS